MNKYFARIDGETCGPFELSRLPEVGVRPSTYVWCKGMEDWEKAEDVAEICRLFRNHIFDLMHPAPVSSLPDCVGTTQNTDFSPSRFDRYLNHDGQPALPSLEDIEHSKDKSRKPKDMTVWAILSFLVCPPLGAAAVFYSLQTKKIWKRYMSVKDSDIPDDEKRFLQNAAHEAARSSKMWTGISFFIALILWSSLIR